MRRWIITVINCRVLRLEIAKPICSEPSKNYSALIINFYAVGHCGETCSFDLAEQQAE